MGLCNSSYNYNPICVLYNKEYEIKKENDQDERL